MAGDLRRADPVPRANPDNQKLADLVDTAFKGETLRGMLLNAYAFYQMGQIAWIAAIVAFIGGAADAAAQPVRVPAHAPGRCPTRKS